MEREERTIKDLSPGQSAWTTPWGLHEAQGKKWLHPNYPAYSNPRGTVQMKVTALAPKGSQTDRYFVHTGRHGIIVGLAPFGGPEKSEGEKSYPCERCGALVRYDCDDQWVETLSGTYRFRKRKTPQESDGVKHETWLEYHDRLVREYYDFDTEWARIKEICPEVEKTEARKEDPVFRPLARGVVTALRGTFFAALLLAAVWLFGEAVMFFIATVF